LSHEQQIQALGAALASARLTTLFQGGIIGLVLGGSTIYFLARNRRKVEDDEFGQDTDETLAEDDTIDQELDRALDFIDRVFAWAKEHSPMRGQKRVDEKAKTSPEAGGAPDDGRPNDA
jgi:hypothetical protein